MKIAIYVNLLAIACCAVAFPGPSSFDAPDELDLTKLVPKKVYGEPINPVKTADLPGSRIVGGTELAPHTAPYQVALLVNGYILCGGSLISTTRVLATAFCNEGASYVEVRLGAHRFGDDEATQVHITSTSVILHESYNVNGFHENDIAIIVLPTPVALSDYIDVVALAPATAGTYEGTWGLVAGWGVPNDGSGLLAPALRGFYGNVISNSDCRSNYGADRVPDTVLCTSGTGIVSICDSDQGGALVVNKVQIGMAAFSGQCDLGLPSGYTRISSFRSWIDTYADL